MAWRPGVRVTLRETFFPGVRPQAAGPLINQLPVTLRQGLALAAGPLINQLPGDWKDWQDLQDKQSWKLAE